MMFPQSLTDPPAEREAMPLPRPAHPERLDNVFENPANGYREVGGTAFSWLWCLLFGFFYLAVKGAWAHALIAVVVAVCTLGWSWLAYPFFARAIVDASYLKRGWRRVADGSAPTTFAESAERLRQRALHN